MIGVLLFLLLALGIVVLAIQKLPHHLSLKSDALLVN
jgi:hypothetical protein